MTQYTDRHETYQNGVLIDSRDVITERVGEEDQHYLAATRLDQARATLLQWSQDAATADAEWDSLTQAQKNARMQVVIRRLGVFFDRFADLLLVDGKS